VLAVRTYLGDRGAQVAVWQRVLIADALLTPPADGIHGPATEAASVLYEQRHGTQEHPAPLSTAARAKRFGAFAFVPAPTAADPQAIRITDGWAATHVVSVHLPWLRGLPGGPESCRIPWHVDGVDALLGLWRAWDAAGLLPLVLSWSGSWCPRFMRGSTTVLSSHAWATAFDVNAAWNGLRRNPAPIGAKGSVRELVPLAEGYGFAWRGWCPTPDGMHFELA
jgi:hypothetical protein